MWRSLARSKQVVARNFGAIQNPKVQSSKTLVFISQSHSDSSTWLFARPSFIYIQNPRFFSQASADQSDYDSPLSHDKEQASLGYDKNEAAQVDHFDDGNDKNDIFGESSPDFVGNGWTQMNDIAGAVDVDGGRDSLEETSGFDDEKLELEVFEIDTEQLESVLSLLQSSVDGSLESSLDSMGLHLHELFVVKVLETPHLLGENLIGFFKWAMKKPEFKVTTGVVDGLVRAVSSDARTRDVYALWNLVKEIGEKENDVLNVDILNKLIASFAKLGKGKAAFEVFNKCEDFGCAPNSETYYFTIEALCRRSIFEWAWSVCENMLDSGRLPDSERVGKIIAWFCKGHKAKEAHLVYTLAIEKQKNLRQSSVNLLISSLCQRDESVKLALEMLNDFSGEAPGHAIKPFSAVIRALCRMKEVDEAAHLVSKMISEGPPPGNAVFNFVINGYSKAGDLEKAMEMTKLMESRGLKPDVYTYTVVMSGYANGGQMEEACKIFSEAKKKHSKLSPVTYHTLIRGYCKLEEFDKALKLLAEMKDFGVEANVDEYSKLIQSVCLKALDWATAETLFEEMKEKGLHLNGITHALIRAVKELEEEGLGNVEEKIKA